MFIPWSFFSLEEGWSHITKLPEILLSPALPDTGHWILLAEICHILCLSFVSAFFFLILLLNKTKQKRLIFGYVSTGKLKLSKPEKIFEYP